MTLVVAADEAGYGPNLGPLVVAATIWEASCGAGDLDASFAVLADSIDGLWGDSKKIYRAGQGWGALETGVLAGVLLAGGQMPVSWGELGRAIHVVEAMVPPPEHREREAIALPRSGFAATCGARAEAVGNRLMAAGLRLRGIRCRIVQPAEFNMLLDAGLNKSDILSHVTLDLVAAPVAEAAREAVVWCDRHGGRRRYAPLVSRAFSAPMVQVVAEAAARSAYHIPERNCRIEFSVGGEARLPVALASMTAKYMRELSMAAFNAHWRRCMPSLEPTAGYPVDASRWRREAAAAVEASGVPWDAIWRRA